MRLIVELSSESTRQLREKNELSEPLSQLLLSLETHGYQLNSLYPDESDPLESTLFYIDVTDVKTAELLHQRLLESDVVKTAYLKPLAETP